MKRQMITALALAALTAGVVYAQHVTTDSDPAAPFATYKTYAWTPGTASAVSLTEQRIHEGVNAQLQGKGMTQVDSNPNVFVATHVTTHAVPQVIADGFGPWGFGGGMATVQTYTEGTLVVDLYDATTRKMVWRGVATATVSDKPEKNAVKIDKSLAKLFARYPPGVGTSR
ncbi:MAG TPA: DUF4136 domain-containing protein [Vicinamibacterales bacterium]|jgi:hypothetical protein|nr:DUF4136 domain-containing protein [Vicinamibacterales bacterium]